MTTPETLLTDRVPPHDLGTERAILGAALSDIRVAERLASRLQPEDFYKDGHQRLFKVMSDLLEAGRGVDIGLLAAAGRQAGLEQPVLDTIPQMVEEAATPALIDDYVRVILDHSARRETIRLAVEAIARAYDGAGSATSLAGDLGEALQQVAARADLAPTPAEIDVTLGLAAQRVVEQLERGERPAFLPTPFPWLDEQLGGGLLPGELVFLGGRPGVAKSALALEWATLTAQKGFPALVISREMTGDALARRALAQQGHVLARRLRSGRIEADDLRRLKATVPRLHAMPLRFDEGSASIVQIQRAVASAAKTGLRFLIVDYLQLVRGPKGTDRRLEVEAVSAGLKGLALRHKLAILALSSLTPPPPGKNNKRARPDMANLRESRALEHDADIVLLLHRPDPDAPGRELILDKARDGALAGARSTSRAPISGSVRPPAGPSCRPWTLTTREMRCPSDELGTTRR